MERLCCTRCISADRQTQKRAGTSSLGPVAVAVLRLNRCACVKDEAPPGCTVTRSSPLSPPHPPSFKTSVGFFLPPHNLPSIPPTCSTPEHSLVCLSVCPGSYLFSSHFPALASSPTLARLRDEKLTTSLQVTRQRHCDCGLESCVISQDFSFHFFAGSRFKMVFQHKAIGDITDLKVQ